MRIEPSGLDLESEATHPAPAMARDRSAVSAASGIRSILEETFAHEIIDDLSDLRSELRAVTFELVLKAIDQAGDGDAIAGQFPDTGAGVVQLVDPVRAEVDDDGSLANPARHDVRAPPHRGCRAVEVGHTFVEGSDKRGERPELFRPIIGFELTGRRRTGQGGAGGEGTCRNLPYDGPDTQMGLSQPNEIGAGPGLQLLA